MTRFSVLLSLGMLATAMLAQAQAEPPPANDRVDECENVNSATFLEDAKVAQIAEAYSLDAVDFVQEHFRSKLDWSDASVSKIEEILQTFYTQRARAKPTDEQVWMFSKMFGSYVGEVYRKNHGGRWGMVTLGGEPMPGFETAGCVLFWPWGRVEKRLSNGPEDNVWHYYQSLLDRTK